MANTRIVGIDFGTSTSVVRVKRYDENNNPLVDKLTTQSVVFNMGSSMVPTLIRKCGNAVYYGYDAEIKKRNSDLYQIFKIDLESSDPQKKAEARALTASFFEYLGKVYREQRDNGHLGALDDIEKTYISYPVKWSEDTKNFMVSTAKNAGFANVEGIDEAQAAIHAVLTLNEEQIGKKGFLSGNSSLKILLLDMGAGTTDLVLCQYDLRNKKVDTLCTWPTDGDILFGGKEADEVLKSYIEARLPEEDVDMVMKRCAITSFKSWKETLVSPTLTKNETVTEFSDLDNILEIMDIEMESLALNRSEFEKAGSSYMRKLPELIRGCMNASGISASDIDLVVLTGGHSQWYFVQEMLLGQMNELGETALTKIQKDPSRILTIPRPQETVALGLVFNPLTAPESTIEPEPTPEPTPEPAPIPQPAPIASVPEANSTVQPNPKPPAAPKKEFPKTEPPKKSPSSLEEQRRIIACYKAMDIQALRRFVTSGEFGTELERGCALYALATREKDLGIDEWFQNLEHAAQEGIADAQAELGATYLYDKNLPQDDEKTFQYLKNAADQGVGIAYKDLGVFYATQEIYDQALLAYEKAKEFGHDDTDSLMFVTSIRQYLNEANLFRYISYVNGYNTEMTSQAQRILAQRLNEDYNELRADCLFGASEADFVGNINAVFLTAEGIYTCAKGGEVCSFLPWREFVGLTLYKESYSALSFKDTVIFNRNGLKQILIPYVSNAAFLLPELKKLQNRFAALFTKYRHLFD